MQENAKGYKNTSSFWINISDTALHVESWAYYGTLKITQALQATVAQKFVAHKPHNPRNVSNHNQQNHCHQF